MGVPHIDGNPDVDTLLAVEYVAERSGQLAPELMQDDVEILINFVADECHLHVFVLQGSALAYRYEKGPVDNSFIFSDLLLCRSTRSSTPKRGFPRSTIARSPLTIDTSGT